MASVISESLVQKNAPLLTRLGNYFSLRVVMPYFRYHSNVTILDIGCGYDAELLTYFSDKITYGLGLDSEINPALRNSLPPRNNLHFLLGDINTTINEINTKFDIITVINFIEHVCDPQRILARARTLLKPNGAMLVLAPTWLDKRFLELVAFNRFNFVSINGKKSIDEHKDYFTKKTIWKLLVNSGFKPSQLKIRYAKFGLHVCAIANASVPYLPETPPSNKE